MASPQTPKCSIPPSWYELHTSKFNHQYIALPKEASTPPIFLTTFRAADAPALQAILNIPSVNDSLISVPKPYMRADADFWINLQLSETSTPWLQALRTDDPEAGTFVGAVSLLPAASSSYIILGQDDNEHRSKGDYLLGYYLHPALQKQGITCNAVCALLAWAVAEQGVKEVRVDVATENTGSRRLVESLDGFEREGGGQELVWPESKGGGKKKIWSWRWSSS